MGQPPSVCQFGANIGIDSIKYEDYFGFTARIAPRTARLKFRFSDLTLFYAVSSRWSEKNE